jgi:transcriptional regulator with XRE-family HTH domain/tetratricopeptide (TPR) repeat protein
VARLRAHRLARGWTLEHVAREIRLICAHGPGSDAAGISHQRVSKWENGHDLPSPVYLDALCRLYQTRPDMLGIGRDYSPVPSAEPGTAESQPDATAGVPGQSSGGFGQHRDMPGDLNVTAMMSEARLRANAMMESQSASAATIDNWEWLAEEYGRLSTVLQPREFLNSAVPDFAELVSILSHRQPLEFQQRLYRVMGQLASLMVVQSAGAGNLPEARRWVHTARLASDEAADRQLRARVMVIGSMVSFWDGAATDRAIELCQAARSTAGTSASPVGAFAAATQARAHARLGQRREALTAMRHAETEFGRLSPAATAPSHLGMYERSLRYHQECVLTWLGETREAMQVQEHALSLLPDSAIEGALIRLDSAHCLMAIGEIEEARRTAEQAVRSVPAQSRHGVIGLRAEQVLKPPVSRGHHQASGI